MSCPVRFLDKDTRAEHWHRDYFTTTRKVFENFNVNCPKFCISSKVLTKMFDKILCAY